MVFSGVNEIEAKITYYAITISGRAGVSAML